MGRRRFQLHSPEVYEEHFQLSFAWLSLLLRAREAVRPFMSGGMKWACLTGHPECSSFSDSPCPQDAPTLLLPVGGLTGTDRSHREDCVHPVGLGTGFQVSTSAWATRRQWWPRIQATPTLPSTVSAAELTCLTAPVWLLCRLSVDSKFGSG